MKKQAAGSLGHLSQQPRWHSVLTKAMVTDTKERSIQGPLKRMEDRNWEPSGCGYKAEVKDVRWIVALALRLGRCPILLKTLKWLSWTMIDDLEPTVSSHFSILKHKYYFSTKSVPLTFFYWCIFLFSALYVGISSRIYPWLPFLFIFSLSINQSTQVSNYLMLSPVLSLGLSSPNACKPLEFTFPTFIL